MTWVRLDDKFHENPKQLRATHAAVRAWVCSMSYCADCATPTGFMTDEQAAGLVRKLKIAPKVISELVELVAWEPCEGGYLVHDFEYYVPPGSTERVRAFRKRKRNVSVTLSTGRAPEARSPLPVVLKEPPTPYGVPAVSMHVGGLNHVSKILGTMAIQPGPRKETP